MGIEIERFINSSGENFDQVVALIGRLFEVATPDTVFSEPTESNGYTVITASEVTVGMGVGQGFGGGVGPESTGGMATPEEDQEAGSGFGGGGGGGGFSTSRPVATISIGPGGVEVEPIVDVTKVALAFFTMFGSMLLMFSRMQKASRD